MKKTMNDINKEKELENQSYGFYSRILNKVFDTVESLKAAEAEYAAELRAKEDKAATKKADAQKVEEAFKALNAARKNYKETLNQLTAEYSEALVNLKKVFEAGKEDIHKALANAEENYSKALKEFTDKYDQYHVTLKDGDFETTISSQMFTNKDKATNTEAKQLSIFDIFEALFK